MAHTRSSKNTSSKTVRFEPDRVMFMTAVIAVLALVLLGAFAML